MLQTKLNREVDELFSNDIILYGDISAQLVKEIIDPEQHDQIVLFLRMQEVKDQCKLQSVWEIFSTLILHHQAVLTQSDKSKVTAKELLLEHFIATQNQRPEFLFSLILVYL